MPLKKTTKKTKPPRPPGSGKRGPIKGQGGGPRIKFSKKDLERLERLAEAGATQAEMAADLGVDEDTIRRRIHDTPAVGARVKAGQTRMKLSLRRKQLRIALDDTHPKQATMLVWLGKVQLGQSEVRRIRIENEDAAVAKLRELFPDIPEETLRSLASEG